MDVLILTSIYARDSKYKQELTGFGMKGCLSLFSLGFKVLNGDGDIGNGEGKFYT